MRIIVRGWGRDVGETEIMNAPLSDAEEPGGRYSRNTLYKTVVFPNSRFGTKVRISTSTEVRLGGTYLLHVELSRSEIAQLFYETHSGEIVRMFRSFVQDEARADNARRLEQIRQHEEHRQERLTQQDQADQSDQTE
jgi:hypothetical protein